MSSRERGRGRGDAGLTARCLLSTPVDTRPPRNHIAKLLSRCTNTTTLPQNTTHHANNHLNNDHNLRPTHNFTKNATFRVQLRKINPNITTEKHKIYGTTFKSVDVPLTNLKKTTQAITP
ncbi:hypothetical protein FHG87_012919 [Trinorchestia longiramus]|nr:hypothetical protein FHG87_012919 [Trinorchestia longiramus]